MMLSDCVAKDPAQAELFLVQAGQIADFAKKGRNPLDQAVLPVSPSIVDAGTADIGDVLSDPDIMGIVASLGVGIQLNRDVHVGTMRYGRVILVTDPSIGRVRIREHVVAFLYRFSPTVLASGALHVATPRRWRHSDEAEFHKLVLSRKTRTLHQVVPQETLPRTLDTLSR